jgi:polyhydroxyalkanoate synthesis regulator phasin
MGKDYTDVLLEDMNSKFDLLLDVMKSMKEEMSNFAKQPDLEEIKQDVKVIKHAVTETNKDVQGLNLRVAHLESRA